ncbi:uncharacterized protein BYT42DRAFT_563287 [Radiomyces spectabilis]|uniref:uncharacterized protein n=1 Tax=Radiomyces spectabilis TaxID=64574 RepID=UPI00221E8190|nr:uncharacterized protein BYT42DRAFT_563287 [Radiomyces spectabilis]KAI8384680.1 hypothetical protein BYT42DRAFT_563287 [Radiomyces spectabilis]
MLFTRVFPRVALPRPVVVPLRSFNKVSSITHAPVPKGAYVDRHVAEELEQPMKGLTQEIGYCEKESQHGVQTRRLAGLLDFNAHKIKHSEKARDTARLTDAFQSLILQDVAMHHRLVKNPLTSKAAAAVTVDPAHGTNVFRGSGRLTFEDNVVADICSRL